MNKSVGQDGYVNDTGYADRLHRELSPAWLNYAAIINGTTPVDLQNAFHYLELGCGYGGTVIANAKAFPHGVFHACDFNPTHVDWAKHQCSDQGVENLTLHEISFEELANTDLPMFDFVVLHGVYSWVGEEARTAIRRIIDDRLKPGGFVYLSYNCLPGWSAEVPMRRLIKELADTISGDASQRASQAVETLQQLNDAKLRYFKFNPVLANAIDAHGKEPPAYLAHEFLNETWETYYSVDIADEMAALDLDFAGSATLTDNHEMLLIDNDQAKAIAGLATPRLRQLAMDFAVNRSFRRDVFSRGAKRLSQTEVLKHISVISVQCTGATENIPVKIRVPRGEIGFQSEFIDALRKQMREGEKTFGTLVDRLAGDKRDPNEIARNLMFLIAAGELQPV